VTISWFRPPPRARGILSARKLEQQDGGPDPTEGDLSKQLIAALNDEWQLRAACCGSDAALFFAPNYFERREEKDAREARAKAICAVCPVQELCLAYALRIREPHGVWGGLNEFERRQVLRRRDLLAG
jgi:WhiB family transcriptional regulator, redox-sensing transcriptional regulator